MARREVTYTVRGRFPFPSDMLRRDLARPADAADAALIARIEGSSVECAEDLDEVRIKLVGSCEPNVGRWQSFGWSVEGHDGVLSGAPISSNTERWRLARSALAKLTPAEAEALDWYAGGNIAVALDEIGATVKPTAEVR